MSATDPHDIVIIDETEPCPYLKGQIARMPLRMPVKLITPDDADRRLAAGHRRTGEFVYQTNCPRCRACEPIRIKIDEFQFRRSHRRVLKRGDQNLTQTIGPLRANQERVDLFNKHRTLRQLAKSESEIDLEEYAWGFVRSCFDSFEIAYRLNNRLICLAVCDRGKTSLSAVYTFYDPDLKTESLGTYSILKQIQWCRQQGFEYLYLGYYVEGCIPMEYKAKFLPNQRLIDGHWISFGTSEQGS